jgi:uncharacterized protein YndB with AHSA1/START domain
MSTLPDSETVLELERLIAAPPELLFALWTEPEHLVRWWAPDGYRAVVDEYDVSEGGRWRIALQSLNNGIAMSGHFRVVEPPRRLVFTWAWESPSGERGHETEVSVKFTAAPGGTRVVLVQQAFEARGARDRHIHGWSTSLDRITVIAGEARP